ncbi:hypothetical protein SU46_00995 [Brachyspira hyodysenteriae]|uniref:hypothetical protein n=1 Tax=Brachyspira hyodysenteriae TaxID=159 RepID=UPI00063DB857|nr:hypothetical protein [Brachyspira hyodysenteriae]KLI21921.1 hypothetical protein SU46_00995 [Brachyspira hyodysenteriae]
MKINKIVNITIISLTVIIILLFLITKKNNIGYIEIFGINIDKTLELNGKYINQENIYTNKQLLLDYIFTNESIKKYVYDFRISYYSKIFRNNDIFGVNLNINSLKSKFNFVDDIKMQDDLGTPFGYLFSSDKIELSKLDNIEYKLKIKYIIFILYIIFIFILLFIKYKDTINKHILIIKKISLYSLLLIFLLMIIIMFIKINRKYNTVLTDFIFIDSSELGYIYKTKLKIEKPILFDINNISIIDNKDIINYYGYSIKLTNDINIYKKNDNNLQLYEYIDYIPTFYGDKYKITANLKQYTTNNKLYLGFYKDYIPISNILEYKTNNTILYCIKDIIYDNNMSKLSFLSEKDLNFNSITIESINDNLVLSGLTSTITLNENINYNDEINISYNLKPNVIYYFIFVLILYSILMLLLANIFSRNKIIIFNIIFINLCFLIFHFWLGFPGYWQNVDNYLIMEQSVNSITNNVHPIIIALTLKIFYSIFGYHSFYLFLINLICWYLGLSLIMIALYKYFKSKWVLILFLLNLISNMFFQNISQLKDVTTNMYIWLLLSILFFILFVNVKNNYLKVLIYVSIYVLLILSLLWRHTAIMTIYPLMIYFVYLFLKKKNISLKKYVTLFCSYMLILAIVFVIIVKGFPYIILDRENRNNDFPTDLIYLLDIVACAVISDDSNLIYDNEYRNGANFNTIKEKYNSNPAWIDYMLGDLNIKNARNKWVKAVLKHPISYLRQKLTMFLAYTTHSVGYIYNYEGISGTAFYYNNSINALKEINDKVLPHFKQNERGLFFNNFRKSCYSFLYSNLIKIKHIFFVIPSFLIMIACIYFIIFKKKYINNLLILSFASSLGAIATTFSVVFITISADVRYIYPLISTSIIAIISFIVYSLKFLNIGKIIKNFLRR